jgi:hypothetical protein
LVANREMRWIGWIGLAGVHPHQRRLWGPTALAQVTPLAHKNTPGVPPEAI